MGAHSRSADRPSVHDDRLPALERTVDVHVFRLREKLHDAHATAAIVTIRGAGYKIMAEGA